MTVTSPTQARRATVQRRIGYVAGLVVNVLLLVAVNAWPGWDVLPFLTSDTREVLPLVNASILVGGGVNVVYLVHDGAWTRAAGEIVTNAVSIAALLRLWDVFPFEFTGSSVDWVLVTRVILVVGVVGSIIGMVARLVTAVRETAARP